MLELFITKGVLGHPGATWPALGQNYWGNPAEFRSPHMSQPDGKANKGYSGSGGPKKIEDIDHCGCRAMFFLKLLDLVSKYAHVCQKIKALNYPRSRRVEWPANGGVSVIFHTQARHLQSFPSSLHICSLQSFPSSFPSWWNMRWQRSINDVVVRTLI